MAQDVTPRRILLSGGTVVDGSGSDGFAADVLVEGDRIAAVGHVEPAEGMLIVDASGAVITPGFIDAHCHGDPLVTPDFENYAAMGVTTICLGQDGQSSAEGGLLADWKARVAAGGCAINVVPFAGHGSLRDASGIGYRPDPSKADLDRLRMLARESLEEGNFGITFGMEYVPGRVAPFEELALLAEEVGRAGGIAMSHVRSEDDDQVEAGWGELMEMGRAGQCHVHVSHMKVTFGKGRQRAREVLRVVEQALRDGVKATGDIYPYTASCTTIGIIFPGWAKTRADFEKALAEGRRGELEETLKRTIKRRGGPAASLLGMEPWRGQTLEQAASKMGKNPETFLIEELGPEGGEGAYFVMDEDLQEELMKPEWVVYSSDGAPEMAHPRGYGSFARIIETFHRQRGLFSLEETVAKMTGRTARLLGMDRQRIGEIHPGWQADLLVFRPEDVKERADYLSPRELAEGFREVLVAGEFLRRDGKPTGSRKGRVL